MTRMSDIDDIQSPTHLLLIGDTKMGKSTYAAQAALDGFLVIYIDADNGLSALQRMVPKGHEARSRILYFGTKKPYTFVDSFLDSGVFRWNLTQDAVYSSASGKPGDQMVQVIPSKVPRGIILVIDSWTSIALDAMEAGAEFKRVDLEAMGSDSQAVYGNAGVKLTLLLAIIQHTKFHVIVQAHGTYFERYEKPLGSQAGVKQKDMILRDQVQVPLSSSRPHGFQMGKYFTDIGWLEMNRANVRELDFTVVHGRVGGGTLNKRAQLSELPFSKTFGPVPTLPEISETWIKYMSHEEFLAAMPAKESTTKPAGSSPSVLPANPARPSVPSLMSPKAK